MSKLYSNFKVTKIGSVFVYAEEATTKYETLFPKKIKMHISRSDDLEIGRYYDLWATECYWHSQSKQIIATRECMGDGKEVKKIYLLDAFRLIE